MSRIAVQHLYWVLWVWLLLSVANGEDGVAKSEKRLVIKQESGPHGDSLVRSFVQTRVSRAFSSTSSFDDERGEEENTKSPDDRQSTIRIKNETVDLSKNTVPVLKYPGPTEPSLKDKYRRSTSPPLTTSVKKSFKLKRNMTRPRPADLTTLLAFNALTPSPSESRLTRPGFMSSSQMTESMPPTAWALASLKGPSETTRKPGPPYVKPFVSWSTRLNKPTTTPSPTTEILEPITGSGESSGDIEATGSDITGEGVESTEINTPQSPENQETSSTSLEFKKPTNTQNITLSSSEPNITNTDKPQDITLYKPEENTISVPPLFSLKNISDISDVKTVIPNNSEDKDLSKAFVNTSGPLDSLLGEHSEEFQKTIEEKTFDSDLNNSSSIISHETEPSVNLKSDLFAANSSVLSESLPNSTESLDTVNFPVTTSAGEHSLKTSVLNDSDLFSTHGIPGPEPLVLKVTEKPVAGNNVILEDNEDKRNGTGSSDNENSPTLFTEQPVFEETRLNETTVSAVPMPIIEPKEMPPQRNDSILNESVHDLDPSINTINVKKIEELSSTSTTVSTTNSSESLDIPLVMTTPGIINLTNLVDEGHKNPEMHFDLGKNLPLTSEAASISNTTHFKTSSLEPVLEIERPNEQQERHHEILNQTSNFIKPINNVKISPFSRESNAENTSSTRSNEIKPELINSEILTSNKTEIKKDISDTQETTQSNYIQVQESVKRQKINMTEESSDKQKDVETPPTLMTTIPSLGQTTDILLQQFSTHSLGTNESMTDESKNENMTVQSDSGSTTEYSKFVNTTQEIKHGNITVEVKPENENVTVEANPENITTTTPIPTVMDETTAPITTTTVPMTTVTPILTVTIVPSTTEMVNLSLSSSEETPQYNTSVFVFPTSSEKPPSSTKTNDIKDQETDINIPISEKNMTQFQYESPNAPKNDSTPLIIREPDDIDEDDVYNSTYFSDKKNTGDSININPGESDEVNEDSFHDILGNSSIPVNHRNISNEIPIPSFSSTSTPTPTSKSTPSPTLDEFIPTQPDEEQSNIDDDQVYDTGVVMPVYVRITFDANYGQLCREKDQLRESVVQLFKKYAQRAVDKRQVIVINLGPRECSSLHGEMNERNFPIHLMLTDPRGQYDQALNDQFVSLLTQSHLDFKYPVMQVEKIVEQHELNMDSESQTSGTVVAAIVISSIAGVCLFALTILLVIMRKRQSGFNYGQRCTPVSLDDYSLDNISVYNSTRRKAMRASKRSYGNPAFDDPDVISNPVNFAGLANMASDKSKTDEEFSSLPQVVVKPDELPVGAEEKNRYANVIPLPETRVQLRGSSPQEQFINANYVKGVKGADKFYIACQAPLQNTIEDFWQMIWDEQSRLIIMLTALSENGVEKCADYLPPSEVLDCHRVFGDLQVTLKKREVREKYVIASLQLKNLETNLWREVTHMWYAGWPPTGVPSEPSSIIAFLIEARSFAKGAPIVAHCSPGTGRTGTVIAIDIAIRDFEAGRSVDIPKTVVQIRRGRAGAVQTKEQYHFIYKVLHLYATKLTGGGLDSI